MQIERWMRQVGVGRLKDGWVKEGRLVTGVCRAVEICNEISVSQTGC